VCSSDLDASPASNDGLAYLWFYFAVYAPATLGAFAALEHLGGAEKELESIDELAGLGRVKPGLAAAMAACMFSLAGIPLLAGFWGKLLVFVAALGVGGAMGWWMTAAVVVAALNAAVAAVYYLRIVAAMYFRPSTADVHARGGAGPWLAAASSAALVVALGLYPGPLLHESRRANEKPPPESAVPREIAKAAAPACPSVWSDGNNDVY
jgi:NADH-quinone oxidoreductase subunit N